jgi:hypothetical protein
MDWLQTPTVVVSLALLLFVMSVTSAVVLSAVLATRWTNRMRDLQTKTLTSRLRDLELTQSDLLNRLMSKDAMTYSTLTAQTNSSVYPNADHMGLTPIGTDEDEYKRYQQQYPGQEPLDDDAEFREYLLPE